MFSSLKRSLNRKSKSNIEPSPLIGLISKKDHGQKNYFLNIQKDVKSFIEGITTSVPQPKVMMPALYAYRLAIAGLYAQGLVLHRDFEMVDKMHFNMMVYVGNSLTKEQQVDFQEKSFTYALEFVDTYGSTLDRLTASYLIMAAKKGVSVYEALYEAFEYEIPNAEQRKFFCDNTATAEFCKIFYSSGRWLPSEHSFQDAVVTVKYIYDVLHNPSMMEDFLSGK